MNEESFSVVPISISVNVSRIDFYNPELCDTIIRLTKKYEIDPSMLKLEITESAYNDNPQQLLDVMRVLQQHGFEILMDDFGSGYSSLNMLKDVPMDILKVDMKFIDDVETSGRAANVMTSIVRMAKWLDMVVVAEGVETAAQYDFLRSIGCDRVQGYYLSRPIDIPSFIELLKSQPALPEAAQNKLDLDNVWGNDSRYNLILNGMIGAIGIYELSEGRLEAVRVNDGYFEMMGGSPQTLFAKRSDAMERVYKPDRAKVMEAVQTAIESGKAEHVDFRSMHAEGHMLWLDVRVRHIGQLGVNEVFYMAINDITHQRELENEAALRQYTDALLTAYNEIIELDYENDTARSIHLKDNAIYGFAPGEGLERLFAYDAENYVHPEDRQAYLNFFRKETILATFAQVEDKEHTVALEFRTMRKDGFRHWVSATIIRLEDAFGQQTYLCCIKDIEQIKSASRVLEDNRALARLEETQAGFRRTVMVVDDNEINRVMLQNILQDTYDVIEAENGRMALDLLEARTIPVSAILLDVMMPVMDGFEFLEYAQNDPVLTTTPIVVMTGEDRKETENRVLSLGATEFLAKPFEPNIIKQRLRNLIALRETAVSKQSVEEIINNLPGAVMVCAADRSMAMEVRFVNKELEALAGYVREEFLLQFGGDLLQIVHPEDRAAFIAEVGESIKTRASFASEMRVLGKDGISWYHAAANFAYMDGEKAVYYALLNDISAQKLAELSLAQQTERTRHQLSVLDMIFRTVPCGIVQYTMEEQPWLLTLNTAAWNIYGFDSEDAYWRAFNGDLLQHIHPADRQRAMTDLQGFLRNGKPMSYEYRILRQDGSSAYLRGTITMTRSLSNEKVAQNVFLDVTEQKEQERALNRQSELYRLMMEESQTLLFDYDVERNVMNLSLHNVGKERSYTTITDYLDSVDTSIRLHPSYRQLFKQALLEMCEAEGTREIEYMGDYFGNGYRWFRAHFQSVLDEDGKVYMVLGRANDIHEERMEADRIAQERSYFESVMTEALLAFEFDVATGAIKPFYQAAPGHKDLFEYEKYANINKHWDLVHPEDRPLLEGMQWLEEDGVEAAQKLGRHETKTEFRVKNRQGEWVWIETTLCLVTSSEDSKTYGFGYIKGIDEKKQLEIKAAYDALTGLYNRAAVQDQMERKLQDSNGMGTFLLIDIDNFKTVNDTYGHQEGDKLLMRVAQVFQKRLRKSDVIGRLGGDEFVAMLCGVDKHFAVIPTIANNIMEDIRGLSASLGFDVPISVSIGISSAPLDGTTFEQLYKAADDLLYAAKAAGKNQYKIER